MPTASACLSPSSRGAVIAHVISIQSQVLHGHVGNAAAIPVMRALGATVTAVPTTLLSNHPHYSSMRGRILDAPLVSDLLAGVEERGLIEQADVLVTGFLGTAEIGRVVTEFVQRARRRKPNLIYVCDPVLGDDDLGGFAAPGLLAVFRDQLLPLATLATPNRWEAKRLTSSSHEPAELLDAITALGPRNVIVTGGASSGEDLQTLVRDESGDWKICTPRLPVRPAGTGDLFAGIVSAELARGSHVRPAAVLACNALFRVLEATSSEPWSEMPLDQELEHAVRAPHRFQPTPLEGDRE